MKLGNSETEEQAFVELKKGIIQNFKSWKNQLSILIASLV